jgi:hypothetical protein
VTKYERKTPIRAIGTQPRRPHPARLPSVLIGAADTHADASKLLAQDAFATRALRASIMRADCLPRLR